MTDFKQLFPGANTPMGFRSLYAEGLSGLSRIYILKGGPGVGKSTLMRKIAIELQSYGYACELWQCSSDSSSIDGVVCRSLGLAVIDGTAPHTVDPCCPGVREEIVNLGEFWNTEQLCKQTREIIALFGDISKDYAQGYEHLQKAQLHRQRLLDICDLPYDKKIEKHLLKELFTAVPPIRAFSTAITDKGPVCYAQSITEGCTVRYILQGRQNRNGAELLSRLSAEAQSRGLSVEEYFCPFDLDTPEILLLPSLSTAIIDCSRAYIKLKPRIGDKCIELLPPIPVTANEHEAEYRGAFEIELENATDCFRHAKEKHDKLEVYYTQAMDFDAVNNKGKELMDKILLLLPKR